MFFEAILLYIPEPPSQYLCPLRPISWCTWRIYVSSPAPVSGQRAENYILHWPLRPLVAHDQAFLMEVDEKYSSDSNPIRIKTAVVKLCVRMELKLHRVAFSHLVIKAPAFFNHAKVCTSRQPWFYPTIPSCSHGLYIRTQSPSPSSGCSDCIPALCFCLYAGRASTSWLRYAALSAAKPVISCNTV